MKFAQLVSSSQYFGECMVALPHQDFFLKVGSLIQSEWRCEQNLEVQNKLHLVNQGNDTVLHIKPKTWQCCCGLGYLLQIFNTCVHSLW